MENTEGVEMEKELYDAAMNGVVEFLDGRSEEYLLRKTLQGMNVLHVAVRYEQLDFIKASLERLSLFPNYYYRLISDQDVSKKNTPLHFAAELRSVKIMQMLYDYCQRVDLAEGDVKPWMLRNSMGNTALHVAIIHGNVDVARFLLEKDPALASIFNNSKQAPLHLAIKHHVDESESMLETLNLLINKRGADLPVQYKSEEDMSSIIKLLVEIASIVTSWPDAEGFTPLLRAASLNTSYKLQTVRLLVQNCPQSAEVCDTTSGKSILHLLINKIPSYNEASSLLSLPQIFSLRNRQDKHGDTPLHIAVRDKDFNMVRALLESQVNLNVVNTDGISVKYLIEQRNVLQELQHRNMTEEECKETDRANVTFLKKKMEELGTYFQYSKDPKGRNFLHKLMQIKNEIRETIDNDEFVGLIKEIVNRFPSIVCQTDQDGNTPVHILVQNVSFGHLLSLDLLKIYKNEDHYYQPWLVINAECNTPLHEAILACNKDLALQLLEYDKEAAAMVNKYGETPLHLLAKVNTDDLTLFHKEDIVKMVEANKEATIWQDEKGLTPILRAFKDGNVCIGNILCETLPQAAAIVDTDGNSFLHYLFRHRSSYIVYRLLIRKELRVLSAIRNADGNTPLHLAIKEHRFDIVQVLFDAWDLEQDYKLLHIPNKAGKTPADLLSEIPYLPVQIEKIMSGNALTKGIRSSWNISESKRNEYLNSMNVIAALLTTITFTAAFTVLGD